MPDPDMVDALVRTGTHLAAGGGGAGLVAWLSRMVSAKEAQAVATELALLRNDVKHVLDTLEEHKKVFEDVVETKLAVKAAHTRMDDLSRRMERLEAKRR